MKWTQEQSNAIDMPVSDMIVSAAAGSGKTAVMAERILKRLTQYPCVDIDKILVVTYTSAAASEIKERIMKKIVEKLDESKDSELLSQQLLKLPYAHISTIHGFCLELIKKYFYLLDVDPGVKIADETQVQNLKKQCADEVMSNHYNLEDELFLSLISDYTDRKDTPITEAIIKLYDFSRTMPDSEKWINGLTAPYLPGCKESLSYIAHCASMAGKSAISEYDRALELCSDREDCIILKNFLLKESQSISCAIEKETYEEMYEAFQSVAFANWREAKGDAQIREMCKVFRDRAKDIVKKNVIDKYFIYSIEEIERDNEKALPFVEKLSQLTLEFFEVYATAKKENNIIDFSDFEHMTLRLLKNEDGTPSDVALRVSESFEEIYVDEFQDCNNIQNTIFQYISGSVRNKPNVFCVGDMKQSIYSFRDSNPLIFRDKSDKFPLYEGGECQRENKILLNANFRSRKPVLDFVNSLFLQIMSRDCGDITYDENEFLNYGGEYKQVNSDTNFIDIDIIDKSNTFAEFVPFDDSDDISGIEAEAIYVASKIKKMITEGYKLCSNKDNIERNACCRDFVILLRSVKTSAPIFEKALAAAGIPAYCDSGTPYFDTQEIKFLLSFLKIIDNPDDDISLVAVMRNPIFGFDENELMEIRLNNRLVSYYECIKNYIKNFENSLSEKIRRFLDMLEGYHRKTRYMDANEFLRYLTEDINYFAYLSSFEDSKLKKANVRFFIQKAKEFENDGFRGIHSFVDYIETYSKSNSSESAKIIGENDDVVRIMSIHKSKGLEFPIVFLSGCGKKFNKTDLASKFVFHKEYGIGVDSVYRNISARFKTINKIAAKLKMSYELISEELRVLYVALTRASEKLVITANVDNGARLLTECEDAVACEPKNINSYKIYSANNFIKLILMGVVRSEGAHTDLLRMSENIINDGCLYNLNLINMSDILSEEIILNEQSMRDEYDGPTDEYEDFKAGLDYSYSHSKNLSLPSNMTVTELKKLHIESEDIYSPFDEVSLSTPKYFGKKQKLSGANLGTLIHFIMENLDFSDVDNEEAINDQLDSLCRSNVLSDEEKSMADISKLTKFFQSNIGKEMRSRFHTMKKEFSFKYLEDAGEIFSVSSDERIVVQGTIDAFFEDENGELVIVDYKTDKVIDSDTDIIAQRYRAQLDYYAKALETICCKKVRNKILYLFDIGKEIAL